jgi:hypothetical protein
MESLVATPDSTIILHGLAQFVLHTPALHILVSAFENLDNFSHFLFSFFQNVLLFHFSSLESSMV